MHISHPFDPIEPIETDTRAFNFVADIGSTDILSTNWTIAVSVKSEVQDPTPAARLINPAYLYNTMSVQLLSGCVDGVLYVLGASVVLADGRTISANAEMLCQSKY
jgi:hypothetical protein